MHKYIHVYTYMYMYISVSSEMSISFQHLSIHPIDYLCMWFSCI